MDILISIFLYVDIYIYIYIYRYPRGYPCATFRYRHEDIPFTMWISLWISRFYLGYLHAINHSSAASHRFIARMLQNCSHLSKFCYRPALPFAQVWSAQAPAQEHRVPTIGPALLPTGSGQAPTRLLSHDAETVGRAQTRPCRGAATEGVPARKSLSVAYRPEYQKAYFHSTGRGNGATGVHQSIL